MCSRATRLAVCAAARIETSGLGWRDGTTTRISAPPVTAWACAPRTRTERRLDDREIPTEDGRRLGLLEDNEELTRERYAACVHAAAALLAQQGFLSDALAIAYLERARSTNLTPTAPSHAPTARS
jgi:hypothetical protein